MAERAWRRALGWSACAGALALAAVAAGLIPAREPPPPETQRFSVEKTLPPQTALRPEAPAAKARPAERPSAPLVALCEAPERGARWFKLALFGDRTSLLVWCKQGYELFALRATGRAPQVVRVARFAARAELPGGATSGDFDADGQTDLVLGVAAREGVVHRSGAGVFWLRGRAQGGYEPARALAETSSVAVASFAQATGHALFVLTAGDVAAQRPGELWAFARAPGLVRQRVVLVGLDPRGLALRAGADASLVEAWALLGQPGKLERLVYDFNAQDVRRDQIASLGLRGAQALAHEPAEQGLLFARDATSVQRVERGATPRLVPFAENAHVGPFALTDLDADQKPDVLAALEDGVAWCGGGSSCAERALPETVKVLDVETAAIGGDGALAPLALVRGPEPGALSLVVLPRPPWPSAEIEFAPSALEQAETVASVALE